jgi:hypothetical protein
MSAKMQLPESVRDKMLAQARQHLVEIEDESKRALVVERIRQRIKDLEEASVVNDPPTPAVPKQQRPGPLAETTQSVIDIVGSLNHTDKGRLDEAVKLVTTSMQAAVSSRNELIRLAQELGVPPNGVPLLMPPPAVTAAQVASFLEAMLTAPKVADEIKVEREQTCLKCDMLKVDPRSGVPFCGMCGCRVSAAHEGWFVRNLTAYEENLPKWGCKHPSRRAGRGWTR